MWIARDCHRSSPTWSTMLSSTRQKRVLSRLAWRCRRRRYGWRCRITVGVSQKSSKHLFLRHFIVRQMLKPRRRMAGDWALPSVRILLSGTVVASGVNRAWERAARFMWSCRGGRRDYSTLDRHHLPLSRGLILVFPPKILIFIAL